MRVSDDGLHPDGARSVDFYLNSEKIPYSHKSRNYVSKEGSYWGLEYLGEGNLVNGENSLVISKQFQTSAAFTLDKILFSEKNLG